MRNDIFGVNRMCVLKYNESSNNSQINFDKMNEGNVGVCVCVIECVHPRNMFHVTISLSAFLGSCVIKRKAENSG